MLRMMDRFRTSHQPRADDEEGVQGEKPGAAWKALGASPGARQDRAELCPFPRQAGQGKISEQPSCPGSPALPVLGKWTYHPDFIQILSLRKGRAGLVTRINAQGVKYFICRSPE